MTDSKLSGRIGIVTGAGSGIGQSIALAFLENGAMVTALDTNPAGLDKLRRRLTVSSDRVLTIVADATETDTPGRIVAATLQQWSRVDILVNNVGGRIGGPGLDASRSEWDATIALSLMSQFLFCQAASRPMISQKSGRIINIASNAGKYRSNTGSSGISYSVAKGGVLQLTRSVAHALGRHSITVNAIAPGSVLTALGKEEEAELPAELKERVIRETPLGYFAEPEEIASIAVFLASDDASYITGATIVASGGWCTS